MRAILLLMLLSSCAIYDNRYCSFMFIDEDLYNRKPHCKLHDNAYGIRSIGTEDARLEADKALRDNLKLEGDPLANTIYSTVRSVGWAYYNYKD